MIVVWDTEQSEPSIVMTDLPSAEAGVCWYGLRFWIEMGFRALKAVGFRWDKTRREDPERVCRHWLVLSVATLWTLAYGSRVEDAVSVGKAPRSSQSASKATVARSSQCSEQTETSRQCVAVGHELAETAAEPGKTLAKGLAASRTLARTSA